MKKGAGRKREEIGEEYLPSKPNYYKSKKSAQEAHECIRPTDINRLPSSMEPILTEEQYKLYEMICQCVR